MKEKLERNVTRLRMIPLPALQQVESLKFKL